MVTTEQICRWVETIEREKMPAPEWIPEKHVFEYRQLTPELVAFLKMVRAASSLHPLDLLTDRGLLYDVGTVMRAVVECHEDALFLMEGNPDTKATVDRFVVHFAKTTIENALTSIPPPVKRDKIQNAASRMFPTLLSGTFGAFGELEKHIKTLHESIWYGWCNSVHSNYAEIMQMYGPRGPRARFQLQGIPRDHIQTEVWEFIKEIKLQAALVLWALAMKLGLGPLADEIGRVIEVDSASR